MEELHGLVKMGLDEIDLQLLQILQTDDRMSYGEIGRQVGLSISGVNARLKKLIANGYVRRFAAQLDPIVAGLDLCAFIQVVLERPEHDRPFVTAALENPAILECHHVTGDFSYFLKVRVKNTAALERLITEQIKTMPGVARTQTTIALSSPKETTELDLHGAGKRVGT
jgi:Lrp/AsnC family leucine-responsive transcriptional regulator